MISVEFLPGRPLRTFYRGAGRIGGFRTSLLKVEEEDLCSEDWIGAVVSPFGGKVNQLAVLSNGQTLKQAVQDDPAYWLGPDADPNWWSRIPLVKLLDTGDRIPVHVHPDDEFAQTVLGLLNGKSENWIVLEAEPNSEVFLGWKADVTEEELADLVERQDVQGLLDRMNRLSAKVGDSIYVPAGIPHSIGSGMLINEVQQSSDASLLLEHVGYASGSDDDSFVGLSRELALTMTNRHKLSLDELQHRMLHDVYTRPGSMIVSEAEQYFDAQLAFGGISLEARFRIALVVDGSGSMSGPGIKSTPIQKGDAFVLPHRAGDVNLEGAQLKVALFSHPELGS